MLAAAQRTIVRLDPRDLLALAVLAGLAALRRRRVLRERDSRKHGVHADRGGALARSSAVVPAFGAGTHTAALGFTVTDSILRRGVFPRENGLDAHAG